MIPSFQASTDSIPSVLATAEVIAYSIFGAAVLLIVPTFILLRQMFKGSIEQGTNPSDAKRSFHRRFWVLTCILVAVAVLSLTPFFQEWLSSNVSGPPEL